ncbi:MAG: B12-binding domain-containing radical SAM protein, partial [Nitrospira sp.]|nr:B12-binding domain-containing radical SAM protein [Nitrospira sp.]
QEEYDMPLDYYYTLKEPGGISCLEAMQLAEEFYQKDFDPWAVRVNAREHVFLYISKYGTNYLPQIYAMKAGQDEPRTDGVQGLITWPVAHAPSEKNSKGEPGMSRVVSHVAP